MNNVSSPLASNARKLAKNYQNQPSYIGANAGLDQELSNKRTQVRKNKAAVNAAETNLKNTKDAEDAASGKVSKKTKSLQNVLGSSTKLTQKQKNMLNDTIGKGKKINLDTAGLSNISDPKVLDAIKKYNAALDGSADATTKRKLAEEALETANKNLLDSETDLAEATVQNEIEKFNNAKEFFEMRNAYEQSKYNKKSSEYSIQNFAEGYMDTNEYKTKRGANSKNIKTSREEATALRKSLAESVKKGKIVYGSDEYKELITQINDLETNVNDTRRSQLELFKDWTNVPFEKAAKAVEKLSNAFTALNGATQAFRSGGSAVKAFLDNVGGSLAG